MVCGLGLRRGQETISLLGVYAALNTKESDKWQGRVVRPARSGKGCDSEGRLAEQSCRNAVAFAFW